MRAIGRPRRAGDRQCLRSNAAISSRPARSASLPPVPASPRLQERSGISSTAGPTTTGAAGPPVPDRLNQGPFTNYGADANAPGGEVVMATSPSREIVPNYGMGLTVYVSGDIGPPRLPGQTLERSIEDLIKLPFVQKVYLRPNWREVQNRPGRLDLPDWWNITFDLARQYGKRVGFRIMLENPDFPEPGMPEFLMEKVPYVPPQGQLAGRSRRRSAIARSTRCRATTTRPIRPRSTN